MAPIHQSTISGEDDRKRQVSVPYPLGMSRHCAARWLLGFPEPAILVELANVIDRYLTNGELPSEIPEPSGIPNGSPTGDLATVLLRHPPNPVHTNGECVEFRRHKEAHLILRCRGLLVVVDRVLFTPGGLSLRLGLWPRCPTASGVHLHFGSTNGCSRRSTQRPASSAMPSLVDPVHRR